MSNSARPASGGGGGGGGGIRGFFSKLRKPSDLSMNGQVFLIFVISIKINTTKLNSIEVVAFKEGKLKFAEIDLHTNTYTNTIHTKVLKKILIGQRILGLGLPGFFSFFLVGFFVAESLRVTYVFHFNALAY